MARRRYRPEQIVRKLREVEILLGQGSTIGEAIRKIEVAEITITLTAEYDGMRIGKDMCSHASINNVYMLSSSMLQTLAPHRGQR